MAKPRERVQEFAHSSIKRTPGPSESVKGKLVDQKAHKGYIELLGKVKRCNNSNTSSEVKISIRQGCADAIEIYDWEHPWLLSF
ncbi:uncharacterized protein PHALS_04680 [Plasmopara halstedii]|uniref:Uncharacterized protein n=1 Tax=Plasmopara halstedii TaxID=4781 RepID=A0A0P1AA70_PLAHL|nr:uncharacterized protein PHALS_04680 [Plasmopara halstedii]CEG37238.1 hypothetical protein PHALS_04680 [Plasmopara halstedii]|eukprot:XP_024573607.1 hypothetical protein PHALS_04680 [Plasmopara halstedii]